MVINQLQSAARGAIKRSF